eukprot:GHVR01156545.1.p1 GENE.GHVR01156545.1~~GHVR01156545.1.p1  ORF type:complete len:129 (+),score=12.09 GHVR01156545.1:357-743(+)
MAASENGYVKKVKYLIENGAKFNLRNVKGDTPLLLASYKGHLNVVKLLTEKGLDINVRNTKDGNTALMIASKEQHVEIVKYLIERGAEVNLRNVKRQTALTITGYSITGYRSVVAIITELLMAARGIK